MVWRFFIGKESFWYPYFQVVTESDLLCFWNDDEFEELQDNVMVEEAKKYLRDMQKQWKLLEKHVFLKYPEVFPEGR